MLRRWRVLVEAGVVVEEAVGMWFFVCLMRGRERWCRLVGGGMCCWQMCKQLIRWVGCRARRKMCGGGFEEDARRDGTVAAEEDVVRQVYATSEARETAGDVDKQVYVSGEAGDEGSESGSVGSCGGSCCGIEEDCVQEEDVVRGDVASRECGIEVPAGGGGADAGYMISDLQFCEVADVTMEERNLAWNRYVDRDPTAWKGTPAWQARLMPYCGGRELTKAQWRRMRCIWGLQLREQGFAGSRDVDGVYEEYEVLYEASRRMQDDMWRECVEEVREEWRSRRRIWREVNFRTYMAIRQGCDTRDLSWKGGL